MATPMARSHLSTHRSTPDPMAMKVRVALRVRPFLPSESQHNSPNVAPCVTLLHSDGSTGEEEVTVHIKDHWSSRNEVYKLDSFFDQRDHVEHIFHREVCGVIPGIFKGYNATVFAYGATGSGKTYTMQGTEDEQGLIPLAMRAIFTAAKETESLVEISYFEVYMEKCYDLLEPKAKEIMTLDDREGQLQLKGLSWIPVVSMDEFHLVYNTGVQRRKVAHTGLNDVSSRSHAVLAIAVTDGSVKGKLNLIDLAGNEDNRRTCNEGTRLQESAKINQSLFALSNVIYALNNNEPRIPYRESKLTRILQDSLGGTSRALMIACLNPSSYPEAVRTVSLAARSRHVMNYVGPTSKQETPREKVDMEAKLRAWLELKGKTRSIQRMNGLCSPLSSVGVSERSVSTCATIKDKTRDPNASYVKGRKLFDSEVKTPSAKETTRSSKMCSNQSKHSKAYDENSIVPIDEGSSQAALQLQNLDKYENPCLGEVVDTEPQSTLFDNILPSGSEVTRAEDQICDTLNPSAITIPGSEMNNGERIDYDGMPCEKENEHHILDGIRSPPISEKLHSLQSSFTKVLSMIPDNVATSEDSLMKEGVCAISFDPKTPKSSYQKDPCNMSGMLHDNFDALSSNLKESAVNGYLSFLNVASKEELLQLKGIGPKRAEYILQLREKTPKPLKTLSDLEKIGLSSKQVHGMFTKAARGIFT